MIKTKTVPNRNRGLLITLGAITIFLALLQILIFIFFSNQSGRLSQINQKKNLLVIENNELEKEIAQLASLPILEEQARKIGFVVPSRQDSWSSIIYLTRKLPIAVAN